MRNNKKSGLLSAFQSIKEQIIPTRTKKAFWSYAFKAQKSIWLHSILPNDKKEFVVI